MIPRGPCRRWASNVKRWVKYSQLLFGVVRLKVKESGQVLTLPSDSLASRSRKRRASPCRRAIAGNASPAHRRSQGVEKAGPIRVVPHDCLALVAPRGDVIDTARQRES